MITTHEQQAEFISINGAETGRAIWSAIECAIEAGLPGRKARIVFDGMLASIVDDMPADESDLFAASAYEALPASAVSMVERAEIDANAWRAYEIYCGDLAAAADDRAAQLADLRYDAARDAAA